MINKVKNQIFTPFLLFIFVVQIESPSFGENSSLISMESTVSYARGGHSGGHGGGGRAGGRAGRGGQVNRGNRGKAQSHRSSAGRSQQRSRDRHQGFQRDHRQNHQRDNRNNRRDHRNDRRDHGRDYRRDGRRYDRHHNYNRRHYDRYHHRHRNYWGRDWWGGFYGSLWSPNYVWPTYGVFNNFFASELTVLPQLGLPADEVLGLTNEINALQAQLQAQGNNAAVNDAALQQQIAALIERLLKVDPGFNPQTLFGNQGGGNLSIEQIEPGYDDEAPYEIPYLPGGGAY